LRPLNDAQASPEVQFAQIMRDQLSGSGIPPSTYVDSGGLNPRADIAELHLAQSHQSRELGNMKNPSDSARMRTLERP
jgi:N-acetylmuramoyl-L-alanine amidase